MNKRVKFTKLMNQEVLVRVSLLQHVVDPFLRKMDRQSVSTAGSIEKIYDSISRVSMLGNLLPITQSAPTIRWDRSAIPWFYLNLRNRARHTASTYSATVNLTSFIRIVIIFFFLVRWIFLFRYSSIQHP